MSVHSTRALRAFVVCAISVAVAAGCSDRPLRGWVKPSPDGGTYLAIEDDNGGQACDTILVDGKPWRHGLHVAGRIAPGTHVIECGGGMEFIIEPGTVFHLDYWGP